MSAVDELLVRFTEIGAIIRPEGDRLILRAGATPVPAELVNRLRRAKPQVIAALSQITRPVGSTPDGVVDSAEAHRWRDLFATRITDWFHGDRGWEEARRLAWGDVENEWHELHGRRWPPWQCAGCNAPLGGSEVLSLPDGNRVHFAPIACLFRFGKRWRGDASEALVALGLEPPRLDGGQL
jgi:hypothetical protein